MLLFPWTVQIGIAGSLRLSYVGAARTRCVVRCRVGVVSIVSL